MRCLALTFAAVLTLAAAARADDGTAGFSNGALVFGQSTTIVMEKETLSISLKRITADFTFTNKGDKPETLTVAFPLPDIKTAESDDLNIPVENSDNFVGFTTEVDGRRIRQKTEQRAFLDTGKDITDALKIHGVPLVRPYGTLLDILDGLPESGQRKLIDLGAATGKVGDISPAWTTKTKFYFEQTFDPGKPVHIVHTYHPSYDASNQTFYSGDSRPTPEQVKTFCLTPKTEADIKALERGKPRDMPYAVQFALSYVLWTAKSWAGPIGEFRLIIDKEKKDAAAFCVAAKPVSPVRYEFTARDYVPDRDLDIIFFE